MSKELPIKRITSSGVFEKVKGRIINIATIARTIVNLLSSGLNILARKPPISLLVLSDPFSLKARLKWSSVNI